MRRASSGEPDVREAKVSLRLRRSGPALTLRHAVALGGLAALLAAAGCGRERRLLGGAEALALLRSIEGMRPVESRLAGFAGHAPCRSLAKEEREERLLPAVACSGPPPAGGAGRRALERVGRAIRSGPPSSDLEYAAGLWWLIQRTAPGAAEHAVGHLEAAVAAGADSAALLNDLGAAYFERAHREDRAGDLVRALDAIELALERDPDLAEARFNRALALERLGLCAPAESAWGDALVAEVRPAWSGEISARRAAIDCAWPAWSEIAAWASGAGDQPPAALDRLLVLAPAEALQRALDELLPAWADDYLAGDLARASTRLARVRRLGDELQRRSGDKSVLRLARALEHPSPDAARRLAEAHREYGRAAGLRADSRYAEAERSFLRAGESGGCGGSPLALWARHGAVVARIAAADHASARTMLRELRAEPTLAALPALEAQVAWSEGLIELRTGGFAESRQRFDAAAKIYRGMGDPVQAGAARALAGESLYALGLGAEAWQARVEALTALGRRPSGTLHNLLIDAALAAREEGFPRAALTLQTAGLESARTLESISRVVEALLWRSKVLVALGREPEALADLEAALAGAGGLPDRAMRRRLSADVQEARGALLLAREPAAAVAALSDAVAVYRDTAYAWKLPATLLLRAEAWRLLGESARAEADLGAAIDEFERRDLAMPPELLRLSHFERAQEIFDQMIRLQLDRGRPDLALGYSERARRAAWAGAAGKGSEVGGEGRAADPAPAVAVAAVPGGVAVIEYAVVGDRLLTWVVHDGRIGFFERPLGGLAARVEGFARVLSAPAAGAMEVEVAAEALHRELVAPWIGGVPAGTHLVFAPDRFLHAVAFGALRDPGSHRWLADDYVVSTTPGLSFAVGAEHPGRRPSRRSGVLLVGDPRFDPGEAGELGVLQGAAEEIRQLEQLHPGARVLTGEEARRDVVVAALAEAEVVHYAGHGFANPRQPWNSFLPLARPADGGTGLLLARELYSPARGPWRVVVLSACGAASDGRLRSAGFAPLVSAFLAAGAESVVSSLWSVDDRAVVPLAVGLHRGLAAGLSAPEALDRARRELLERTPATPPHLWASFQVTGVAGRR